jgi:hypothetical protein
MINASCGRAAKRFKRFSTAYRVLCGAHDLSSPSRTSNVGGAGLGEPSSKLEETYDIEDEEASEDEADIGVGELGFELGDKILISLVVLSSAPWRISSTPIVEMIFSTISSEFVAPSQETQILLSPNKSAIEEWCITR